MSLPPGKAYGVVRYTYVRKLFAINRGRTSAKTICLEWLLILAVQVYPGIIHATIHGNCWVCTAWNCVECTHKHKVPGSDKGLLRIVNSISNAVGFFYPRCEHLFFPPKKPFLVDISESLSPLNNFSSPSISNNSNIAVERYIFATSVLLNINIFLQKKAKMKLLTSTESNLQCWCC